MGQSDNNNRVELYTFLNVLQQVVHLFPYDKNIIEIGSMNGNDAHFLAENLKVNNSNVSIVEANPNFAKQIRNSYPDYDVHEFAVSSKDGKVYFNSAKDEDDGRSSIYDRDIYQNDNFEKIEVESITGLSFLKKENIDNVFALKLDVEGASYEVLQSFGDKIESIFGIQVETERAQVWDDQKTKNEVFRYLSERGFELIWQCDVGIQNDSIWLNKRYA
jgi:FkbM family methyltransferase